jgi:phosphoribosylanthranilate isomerase
MSRTRVKICCIHTPAEAWMAINAGADVLGLVGPMPSGPGQIDLPTVQRVTAQMPAGVSGWLLSTATTVDAIISAAQAAHVQGIQLVAGVDPEVCAQVRAALPALRIVCVLHVDGESTVQAARRIAPHVHGVLLDSGKPDADVPTYGGTGATHDWRISKRVVDAEQTPVWLAGGLTPENVAEAITRVRPFGVDVCSKLRIDGKLDSARLSAFMAAVRGATD